MSKDWLRKWVCGNRMPLRAVLHLVAVIVSGTLFLNGAASAQPATLRVGHFPNITHVQALVGHALSRQGKGWFEARLGPDVKIEWFVYNAGPSAIEAIFANALDLTYVGPNPAINGHVRARGEDIRIVAGAVNGGAGLVVQPDQGLTDAASFKGRKIGTPQLGNTQDVAARTWLSAGGLRITQTGGDAQVIPTANPDQLSLFKSRQLDAVWTIEPWLSRLEQEAGGKVLVEESDAITTVLAAGVKTLKDRRPLVTKFVAAHRELTEWIKANPGEAQRLAREQLEVETRAPIPADLIARSWARISLTDTVSPTALDTFFRNAQRAGFLRGTTNLARLIEVP
jgi:NitT/TauT family transport system substrate-binding protein